MDFLIQPTPTIEWKHESVRLIDQTQLPLNETYITTKDYKVVCDAIFRLSIRGAPAIGVAGAYACVLAVNEINEKNNSHFLKIFFEMADEIKSTRPTAVNLAWAVDQMKFLAQSFSGSITDLKRTLLEKAHQIKTDDLMRCHKLSLIGADIIPHSGNVMTICNTGGLATAGIGTALGVIQYAHAMGKNVQVFVCETRPLLQGARLNTWELKRTQTPFTLLTDSMAAQTMKNIGLDAVIVGADRIVANGDTANKIGTYSLAVLAQHHKIPFYVAAPLSTVDFHTKTGKNIPVEYRSPDEITGINNNPITFEDIDVMTPAFDVTPANLIGGIITEKGMATFPFTESLEKQRNET